MIYIYFVLAINLIKKNSKNQIKLLNSFYSLYRNENSNIINLKENDIEKNSPEKQKDTKNHEKLKKIIEENNYIDNLIKIINDKLSNNVENYINEFDNISLIEKDLIPFAPERDNCKNLLAIKSESGINVNQSFTNEIKNKEQNKLNIEMTKLDAQLKNLDSHAFSNKSYIISHNNTPLTLINIDLKKEKQSKVENDSNDNKDVTYENALNNDKANISYYEGKESSIGSEYSIFNDEINFGCFINCFNSD